MTAAGWCWAGVLAGRTGVVAVGVVIAAGLINGRRRLVIALVAASSIAGAASAVREGATLAAEVPQSVKALAGSAVSDSGAGGFAIMPRHVDVGRGWQAWDGPRLWVRAQGDVEAGQRLIVRGSVRSEGFRTRHGPVAGAIGNAQVTVVGGPRGWMAVGATVRHRVATMFDGGGPGRALVAGFLIGDTTAVPPSDLEALRLSGLSHFVAVSGSNVALVIGGWWILAGLFIVDGRLRSLGGIAVLIIFAIATRWEPSVIRASVMAALVLMGRIVGKPVGAWAALGAAVMASVLVAPELVDSVGFQLSVAATAGVLATAGAGSGPLGTAAAATVGAQLAVAPLLLLHFGGLPLLAPVANVLAAPLVTVATACGAVGAVMGVDAIAGIAARFADAVTLIANSFAAGPQLGVGGALGVGGLVYAWRRRRWRPPAAAVVALLLIMSAWGPSLPHGPEVIFLDVGQGDSMLIRDGSATVLIDGGPDPAVLRAALRRYGVRRLDLVIVSHPHADHISGLAGLIDQVPVGRLWHPPYRQADPALGELLELAAGHGIPTQAPALGTVATIGSLRLEVLGPLRRYLSLNDGSLVVAVTAGGPRLLAAGDIEVVAQGELDPGRVDILKVPHQGAATSDLDWLAAHSGRVAIVSVGANSYGHPSADVIAELTGAGATVLRTDVEGDISVSLESGTVAR